MLETLALLLLIVTFFALASTGVTPRLRTFYDNRLYRVLLLGMLLIPLISPFVN